MESIPLCEGIKETLQALHQQDCCLGILTSNAVSNIERYLSHHQIREFDFIYGGSSLFGKARLLRKVMKSHNIAPQQACYIGDETRDIEAAKACNIRSVAVSWGFNSPEILAEYAPDYVIHHPIDLLEAILPVMINSADVN